jgi:predicted RNA-binding Zn-ribbon protein involved in translation (DUF1610 family)
MDIRNTSVDMKCPKCGKPFKVKVRQIEKEETVNCSCGQEIEIKDDNGSMKKASKDINKSFKELEKTFKKLGK